MLSPNKLSKFFYLPFLLTGLLISGCNLDVAIKGEGTVVVQNQAAEEKHCDQDNCRFSYGLETVTAIPQPAPGYAFFKWQDRCENVVSCAINLSTGDRKITAIFKPEGAGLELARADLLAETLYSEVFNGFDDFMQQWPTLPSIIDNVEQQLLDSLPPHLKQTEDAFGGLVGEAQLNIIHSTVTNPSSGLSANLSFPEGSISELCEAMLKGGKAYVTHNDQSQTYARQVWSLQLGGSSTHYSGNNPLLFGATVADFLAQNLLDNVDLNAPGHENWLLAFNQEITRLTDWNARTGHFQNETTLNDWAMNNCDDNVIGNRMPLMPNEEMGYEHLATQLTTIAQWMLPLFDDVQNQFPVDAVANFQVPTEFNHWFQKRANDDAIRFYDALSFWPTLNVNESGVLYISMFKVSTTTTDMINLYHTIEQAFAPLAETGFRYHITWDKHNGPADTLLPTPMPFKGTNWETVYVYIFK